MARDRQSEEAARRAADYLRTQLGQDREIPKIGLVLGTGWGGSLPFTGHREFIGFHQIPGFSDLAPLEGHRRAVMCGNLQATDGCRDTHRVIALSGRVHLNERPADPKLYSMVRLQIEMLLQLGVKRLILTCAAGSLQPEIKVGNIVLINGFVTLFAPEMPMFAGEFHSPEDTIDREIMTQLYQLHSPLTMRRAGHVMLRGPFFEGRRYDKRILKMLNGDDGSVGIVGMSVLPEACIASLYEGVKTVPVAFVTNTDSEEHSHEENQRRAAAQSAHLGDFLAQAVTCIARSL